ncbi:MAG: hypothetical protein U0271_39880 [Polyangiaceae bacterium]
MATKRAPAPPKNATSEALEAVIREDPTALGPRSVYTDWLLQQGDPRGELGAIQTAMTTARGLELARLLAAEQAILSANAKSFYGPLARSSRARVTNVDWLGGFPAAFDGFSISDAPRFLEHPAAAFLTRVRSVQFATAPPCLRSAVVDAQSLEAAWRAPHLDELFVGLGGQVAKNARDIPDDPHSTLARIAVAHPTASWLSRGLRPDRLPRLRSINLLRVDSAVIAHAVAAFEAFPEAALGLGLTASRGSFAALGNAAQRVSRLVLDNVGGSALKSLSQVDFSGVTSLHLPDVPRDEHDAYFQLFAPPPRLRSLELGQPSGLVGLPRSLGRSAFAAQIEELELSVDTFGVGRALTENPFPKLTRLALMLPELSIETLETRRFLANDAFPALRTLSIKPIWHLAAAADAPFAERLEVLETSMRGDRDAPELLNHLAKFPKLRRVVLRGDRVLSPSVLEALFSAGPEIEWLERVPRAVFAG